MANYQSSYTQNQAGPPKPPKPVYPRNRGQGKPPPYNPPQGAPPPQAGSQAGTYAQGQQQGRPNWPNPLPQGRPNKPKAPKPTRVEPRHEPMPYDATYLREIGGINTGEGDQLAKISGQRVQGYGTYGLNEGESYSPNQYYDLSSPYSRAALLQDTYQRANPAYTNVNSLANSRMNIYSGAYQSQLDINNAKFEQGRNDLERGASGYYQGLKESERSVRHQADTAKGEAMQRLIARNLANRPTSPGLKGGKFHTAKAIGSTYRVLGKHNGKQWFQLPKTRDNLGNVIDPNGKVVDQGELKRYLDQQRKGRPLNARQYAKNYRDTGSPLSVETRYAKKHNIKFSTSSTRGRGTASKTGADTKKRKK